MKKATLQTVARDVRAIARSVAPLLKPGNQPALKVVPLAKGEIDVGLTIYENSPARLILLGDTVDAIQPTTWDEVQTWAKKLNAYAPSRIDALVLWQRAAKQFKTDLPYWTSEQYAGLSSSAWFQWFGNGNQNTWGKASKGRACAVRRVPI